MDTIRRDSISLACEITNGRSPRVIFCCGYNSSRFGDKASNLEAWCVEQGLAYTRFDYSGHGDSSGDFAEGTISTWLADTLAVIDSAREKSVLLVGSSMGGWLAMLAALARPDRVCGLVLIACAADMTRTYPERLAGLESERDENGRRFYEVENQYDDGEPYRIYQQMIDDSKQHYLLDNIIDINEPVRLIHGMQDDVVEWQRSLEIQRQLRSNEVTVTLLKGGDHRLSAPQDLQRLRAEVESLLNEINHSNCEF